MDCPDELLYSKEHLWVRLEGDYAIVGVTDFAQESLGTVSAVELPDVGDELELEDSFGSVEARKTVADLYAPISGGVVKVNDELTEKPELLNDDPYDDGWLVKVELADVEELKLLLSADDYAEFVDHLQDEE